MRAYAEAVANRIAEMRTPYVVFVRNDKVTYFPDGSEIARQMRANPHCAPMEVGVFDSTAKVEAIEKALEDARCG